jgi:hypothetical protein
MGMTMVDQGTGTVGRKRRPVSIVFRVVYAVIVSAIALTLIIPALVNRGIAVPGWLPWAVVAISLILFVGPVLIGRRPTQGP